MSKWLKGLSKAQARKAFASLPKLRDDEERRFEISKAKKRAASEAKRDPRHQFFNHEVGEDCDASCGNQAEEKQ